MIELLLILIALMIAAYSDHTNGEIPDWLIVWIAAIGFLSYTPERALFGFVYFTIGLVLWLLKIKGVRFWDGGDAKLLGAIGFAYPGLLYGLVLVWVMMFYSIVMKRIQKKKNVRLGPAFLIAFIVSVGIEIILGAMA